MTNDRCERSGNWDEIIARAIISKEVITHIKGNASKIAAECGSAGLSGLMHFARDL